MSTTGPDSDVPDTGTPDTGMSDAGIIATGVAATTLATLTTAALASIIGGRSRGWWWGTAIGALSGAVAGRYRIYDLATGRGRRALIVDHTWALATTTAGVLVAAADLALGSPVERSLSERQNRLVFTRGAVVRRGFAISIGYTVSGAAGTEGRLTPRRRRLVTDHEDVHIWQARRWGPIYPLAYGTWLLIGGVIGFRRWWRDRRTSGRSLMSHLDATAYYCNPFEWSAYTEDRNWPPGGVDPALVWRRPFTSSALLDEIREWRENPTARR